MTGGPDAGTALVVDTSCVCNSALWLRTLFNVLACDASAEEDCCKRSSRLPISPLVCLQARAVAEIRGDAVKAEWGQQIRNYVLHPYKLVKDTRTGTPSASLSVQRSTAECTEATLRFGLFCSCGSVPITCTYAKLHSLRPDSHTLHCWWCCQRACQCVDIGAQCQLLAHVLISCRSILCCRHANL